MGTSHLLPCRRFAHAPIWRLAAPALLISALGAAPSNAQLVRSWGVKVGVAASSVTDDYTKIIEDEIQARPGFEAFVYAEWLTVPVFSLVTEVGYVQRGFKESEHELRDDQNLPAGTYRPSLRFGYLSTAVLGRLRLDGSSVSPYVGAGPRMDILLHSSGEYVGQIVGGDVVTHPVAEAYDTAAYGITLAIGTEINLAGAAGLVIEGRYALDLSDSLSDFPREARNTAFSLLLGVRL